MNRYILPSVGVVVLALLLFHSRSRDDGSDRGALLGTDHQAEPVANVEVADDDKEHKPNNKLSINASQISANRETEPYNPRFLNLPDYRARVDKHLRLKLYNSSPAKDTPECKEIEEILKGYGLGIASVFDAYSIAYRYHHEILPMIEHVTDEEDRNGLIEQIQGGGNRFLPDEKRTEG